MLRVGHAKYEDWIRPDGLLLLAGWAREGRSEEEIASYMRVQLRTLTAYKEKFPPIAQALAQGKDLINFAVENALLKRALGYQYTEERTELNEKTGQKSTKTIKQVPPDVSAQMIWLKNRKPEAWSEKPTTDQAPTGGILLTPLEPLEDPPDEDLPCDEQEDV